MAIKLSEGAGVSTEGNVSDNDLIRRRIWFHGVAIVHHTLIYVESYSLDFSKISDRKLQDLKKYGPCYFTFWNLTFQFVYLLMALVYDYAESNRKTDSKFWKEFKNCLDLIFCGAVYPFGLFVAITFWVIYTIDREMIFPRVYDECLPGWYNLSTHLWIVLVPALELALGANKARHKRNEVVLMWAIQLTYTLVYYVTSFSCGRWLYPIHNTMPTHQKVFFQICLSLLAHVIYETLYFVSHGVKFRSPGITYRIDRVCTKCG